MIVLYDEGCFPVPVIGKSWRIDKDETESLPAMREPFKTILLNRYVLWTSKAVQRKVGPGTLKIVSGSVNGGGCNGIVHKGMNSGAAGIAVKVEEFFPLSQLGEH